jgi:SAM-dependent methyltransferase
MITDNKQTKCLLCGKDAKISAEKYPGYQEPDVFSIYCCQNCNTSFSMPRVSAGNIYENIYKQVGNGGEVPGYDRYYRYFTEIKKKKYPLDYLANSEAVYWAVQDALAQMEQKSGGLYRNAACIVEIGCGLGYLTYALVKEGYNIKGIDISKEAVDKAIENFGEHYICADITQYALQNTEQYDAVIITEVIAHIEDPVGLLKIIMTMLKPGGRIILTTPNKTVYKEDIIWAADLPPIQPWWFSEKSMRYIADKINADVGFTNFSKYYQGNNAYINMDPLKWNRQKAVFDNNGKLLAAKGMLKDVKKLIKKIPFVILLYRKIKIKKSNLYICQDRGVELGVIFQKKSK